MLRSDGNGGATRDGEIGVAVSLGGTPRRVRAGTFGVPKSGFDQIPKRHREVTIVSGR